MDQYEAAREAKWNSSETHYYKTKGETYQFIQDGPTKDDFLVFWKVSNTWVQRGTAKRNDWEGIWTDKE